MSKHIVIAAGGTGGHVFPALAVAQTLKQRGWQVTWIGTAHRLEAKVVPAAGFDFVTIKAKGLRGRGRLQQLLSPLVILAALLQAVCQLLRLRPCVVLGMGGFASGPTGLAAWLLRTPLVIHEQNAVAGTTNRILARLAIQICVAYPQAFVVKKANLTGNPLRAGIEVAATNMQFKDPHTPLRLLVLGGSLGARVINQVVVEAMTVTPTENRPEILHQSGSKHADGVRKAYAQGGVQATVQPFIDDMAAAYQWADVVIARAGALSLAEIAAMGVPSLLVPLPHAIDDHQTANARALSEQGGAILCPQAELSAEVVIQHLKTWQSSPQDLKKIGQQARHCAHIDATQRVVAIIEKTI